jgi:hypothetical protein
MNNPDGEKKSEKQKTEPNTAATSQAKAGQRGPLSKKIPETHRKRHSLLIEMRILTTEPAFEQFTL